MSSAAWWFSAVVVGLLINLASAYAKEPLDRLLARRSQAAATRKAENDAMFKVEAQRVFADRLYAFEHIARLVHEMAWGLLWFLVTFTILISMVVNGWQWLLGSMALLTFAAAISFFRNGFDSRLTIIAATIVGVERDIDRLRAAAAAAKPPGDEAGQPP